MGHNLFRATAVVVLLVCAGCLDATSIDKAEQGATQDTLDAALDSVRPDGAAGHPVTMDSAVHDSTGGAVALPPVEDAGQDKAHDAAGSDAALPPKVMADAGLTEAASSGLVELQVTTKPTPHQAFGQRNVVAIWVEDEAGQPVRLLGRWAATSLQALTHHVEVFDPTPVSSDLGDVDAISAATRRNHSATLQVTWNTRDSAGNALPDGPYRVVIELADSWEEPTLAELVFDKGKSPVKLDVAESATMGPLKLRYTPDVTP